MKKKDLAVKKDKPDSPVINRVQKVGKIPAVAIRATGFSPRFGDSAVHPAAILKIP